MSKPVVFSIFVGNIPTGVNWPRLWSFFDKKLKVIDVFLSKTRIPFNSRFGFVRFRSRNDAAIAIREFNGSKLLDKSLRVAYAKESGRTHFWRKLKSKVSGKGGSHVSSGGMQKDSSSSVRYASAFEDRSFSNSLCQCVMGEPSGEFDYPWLQKEILKSGVKSINVREGPGGSILIFFSEKFVWEENLKSDFCWLNQWLKNIRIWDREEALIERQAWICIQGIPLAYWSHLTFENLANLWRELIKISKKTALKVDLSKCIIKIKCNQFNYINESERLNCNGKSVIVHVHELEECRDVFDNEPMASPDLGFGDSGLNSLRGCDDRGQYPLFAHNKVMSAGKRGSCPRSSDSQYNSRSLDKVEEAATTCDKPSASSVGNRPQTCEALAKRGPAYIDPKVSWEMSKVLGCTSSVSDDEMVAWNVYLDRILESEYK